MALVLQIVAAIVTVLGSLTLYFGTDPSLLTLGNTVMLIGATFMAAGLVTFAVAMAVGRLGAVVRALRDVTAALNAARLPEPMAAAPPAAPDLFAEAAPTEAMPQPPVLAAAPIPAVAPPAASSLSGAAVTGVVGGALAGAAVVGAAQAWSAPSQPIPATEAHASDVAAIAVPAVDDRKEPALAAMTYPDFGATKEPQAVETITEKDWRGDEETLSHAVVEAPIVAGELKAELSEAKDALPVADPMDIEQELAAALGISSLSGPTIAARAPLSVAEPPAALAEEAVALPAIEPSHPEPDATASERADDIERTEAVQRGLEELLRAPVQRPQRQTATEADTLDNDFLARLRDTAFRSPATPSTARIEPGSVEHQAPVAEEEPAVPPPPQPMELDLEAALRAALAEPLPTMSGRPREDRADERVAEAQAETERNAEKIVSEEMTAEPFADDAGGGWSAAPKSDRAEEPSLAKLARDFPELGDLLKPTPVRSADEVLAEPTAEEPVDLSPITAPLLREGVIAGMPFRLYGDGMIEADLPAGATRFASLKEFRAHVGG
jgi:hypothetical protein